MAIKRFSGRTKIVYFPRAASTVLTNNGLVQIVNGYAVLANAGDTAEGVRLIGVSRRSYSSTDGDYATADLAAIEVPIEDFVEWLIDTDSDGGLADTDVGELRDYDTLGANLDASASTNKAMLVTKKVSATKAVVVLVRTATKPQY